MQKIQQQYKKKTLYQKQNRRAGSTAHMIGGVVFLSVFFAACFYVLRTGAAHPDYTRASYHVKEKILTDASMDHSAWIIDGRVYTAGEEYENQFEITKWKDIVQVAISDAHVAALDQKGKVHAAGINNNMQCEMDGLENVKYIAAGANCTVTVMADGSIKVFGVMEEERRKGLIQEQDVKKVSISDDTAVVLHEDGTVSAYGQQDNPACEVQNWKNVIAVSASNTFTVGLTKAGKVLYSGTNDYGQQDAKAWEKVTILDSGTGYVVGVTSDGKNLSAGRNDQGAGEISGWKDVISIAAGYDHTIAICEDGSVVASGYNGTGQCDVHE